MKAKEYVYVWADGVHFNIRLEEYRQCILVLTGATADGHEELIAITDGYRESEQSWKALLSEVKARGLVVDPKLATGDGALGFGKALGQVFPTCREQRCWVHKTANVLDKLIDSTSSPTNRNRKPLLTHRQHIRPSRAAIFKRPQDNRWADFTTDINGRCWILLDSKSSNLTGSRCFE